MVKMSLRMAYSLYLIDICCESQHGLTRALSLHVLQLNDVNTLHLRQDVAFFYELHELTGNCQLNCIKIYLIKTESSL